MLIAEAIVSARLLMQFVEGSLQHRAISLRLAECLDEQASQAGVLGLERRVAPAPPDDQVSARGGQPRGGLTATAGSRVAGSGSSRDQRISSARNISVTSTADRRRARTVMAFGAGRQAPRRERYVAASLTCGFRRRTCERCAPR